MSVISLSMSVSEIARALIVQPYGAPYGSQIGDARRSYLMLEIQCQKQIIEEIKLITNNKVDPETAKWLKDNTTCFAIQIVAAAEVAEVAAAEVDKAEVAAAEVDKVVEAEVAAADEAAEVDKVVEVAAASAAEAHRDMRLPQTDSNASVSGWAQAMRDTHVAL